MNSGVPPWDAPPSFYLWMRATESGDFDLIFKAPLTRDAWLAAKWLFEFPGFRQAYTLSQFRMMKAILEKG